VSGYNSGKRSGEIPGNMLGYSSGSDLGEALCNTLGSDSGKQLGVWFWIATRVRSWAQSRIKVWVSVQVKTWVRRLGKSKHARQEDLFALALVQFEGGDLKESEPRSPCQEEDQRIWFKWKKRVKEEIGPR
jgi:hypothetical protein